jgi:hypothetical protein
MPREAGYSPFGCWSTGEVVMPREAGYSPFGCWSTGEVVMPREAGYSPFEISLKEFIPVFWVIENVRSGVV